MSSSCPCPASPVVELLEPSSTRSKAAEYALITTPAAPRETQARRAHRWGRIRSALLEIVEHRDRPVVGGHDPVVSDDAFDRDQLNKVSSSGA